LQIADYDVPFNLQGLRGRFRNLVFAFGRVVLYLPTVFVFALAERKNKNSKIRSTMLPQAIGHLERATV
jgi:hypothetical protein